MQTAADLRADTRRTHASIHAAVGDLQMFHTCAVENMTASLLYLAEQQEKGENGVCNR